MKVHVQTSLCIKFPLVRVWSGNFPFEILSFYLRSITVVPWSPLRLSHLTISISYRRGIPWILWQFKRGSTCGSFLITTGIESSRVAVKTHVKVKHVCSLSFAASFFSRYTLDNGENHTLSPLRSSRCLDGKSVEEIRRPLPLPRGRSHIVIRASSSCSLCDLIWWLIKSQKNQIKIISFD